MLTHTSKVSGHREASHCTTGTHCLFHPLASVVLQDMKPVVDFLLSRGVSQGDIIKVGRVGAGKQGCDVQPL
jgi:hypothetical protein